MKINIVRKLLNLAYEVRGIKKKRLSQKHDYDFNELGHDGNAVRTLR